MSEEIVAMAVMQAHDGKEQELEATLREFYEMLKRKGYSRDQLFRHGARVFVNVRRWVSAQTRQEAHEDPDVHRYWARLGNICDMKMICERLEELKQT